MNRLVRRSITEKLRMPLVYAVRLFRRVRYFLTIIELKTKGCKVDWSARVHPGAVFERSGGDISIGPRTGIDRGAIIRAMGGSINIGADCSVNAYTFLSGGGGLAIGDHVMIASHVSIYASNHIIVDTSKPMDKQGLSLKGVVIERDVWIGTGVRIVDGVRIGTGSVLAAGAVVTKSTPPLSLNGGVPARVIGSRIDSKRGGGDAPSS